MYDTVIAPKFVEQRPLQHFAAKAFPWLAPVHWLRSHFAVGGWSPLQRLSGMLTAHMTSIAPHNGFTWHPHRGVEIYTWILEGTSPRRPTAARLIGPASSAAVPCDWIEHRSSTRATCRRASTSRSFAGRPRYRGWPWGGGGI